MKRTYSEMVKRWETKNGCSCEYHDDDTDDEYDDEKSFADYLDCLSRMKDMDMKKKIDNLLASGNDDEEYWGENPPGYTSVDFLMEYHDGVYHRTQKQNIEDIIYYVERYYNHLSKLYDGFDAYDVYDKMQHFTDPDYTWGKFDKFLGDVNCALDHMLLDGKLKMTASERYTFT